MLVTTTPNVEGRKIIEYLGVVTGEAIIGANIIRDVFAAVTDIVGGRSSSLRRSSPGSARGGDSRSCRTRRSQRGGNAVVGVDIDYEVLGQGSMLMVAVSGTAVVIE